MTSLALDTSAAIAYLVRSHVAHAAVEAHVAGREVVLTGHSLAETYSVLTRLPGDARLTPTDATRMLEATFGPAHLVPPAVATTLPRVLAPLGISGGAVYDALVALAAREAGATLVTRDRRAAATYAALQAGFELVASA